MVSNSAYLSPALYGAEKTGLVDQKFGNSLWDKIFGKDPELKQVPTMNPQQEQFLQNFIQSLQGNQGNIGQYFQDILGNDPESYQRFSAPYLQQFQQQILPMIRGQFAGQGDSSARDQALGGAGANLQTNLAGLREGLRGQAVGQFGGLSQQGLGTSPFAYQNMQGTPGALGYFAQGAGGALGGGIPGALSSLFGGKKQQTQVG
jgi:hypothetical protein